MLTIHCLNLNNVYNILHFCLFIHLFNFAMLGFKPSTLQMKANSDSTASNKCFLTTCGAYLSGYCDFYLLEHLCLYIPEAFWLINYTIFTLTMSEPSLPWFFFFSKLKYHLHFPAILYSVWLFFLLPSFFRKASVLTFENFLLQLWMRKLFLTSSFGTFATDFQFL